MVRRDIRGKWFLWIGGLLMTLVAGCKQTDDSYGKEPERQQIDKTVAVVAPIGDAATKVRLERTAQWFLDNFREAQQGENVTVNMSIEWYDELSEDLTTLSQRLANRDDVVAVVGPFANESMASFAPACHKSAKPLLAPTATSEEVVRRYAVPSLSGFKPAQFFFWPLTETDIRFSETLMTLYRTLIGNTSAASGQSLNAACFAPSDLYGQTFFDWVPFHAQNLGIELTRNEQYTDGDDLQRRMTDYLLTQKEHLMSAVMSSNFCVVENIRQLCDVARLRRRMLIDEFHVAGIQSSDAPAWDDPEYDYHWESYEALLRTWFGFSALSEESVTGLSDRDKAMVQGYQGFSPYADPSTGFEKAYMERFGTMPTFAECKFYDALLLAGLASCYLQHLQDASDVADDSGTSANQLVNFCLWTMCNEFLEAPSQSEPLWSVSAMRDYLHDLRESRALKRFCGASGHIVFDMENGTQIARTTYVHWQLMDGKIYHRTYYGPEGRQVVSPSASWHILYDEETANNDFSEMAADVSPAIQYPACSDQYAVLVQGSAGHQDYRHLADVLSVYQLLRKGGFDDDHIILLLDKKEVDDNGNVICATNFGKDLMGGTDGLPPAVIDYDNAVLTVADVSNILLGVPTDHTPTVLPHDAGQNVFLYWSGHGRNGEFSWRDTAQGHGFTQALMRQTAQTMLNVEAPACRKLLVVAEPCYGEGVITALNGITGALGISGAGSSEQSWADNWDNTSLIWLSDRFTQNFVACLSDNPTTTYRDLFLYCAEHTLGSHAKIVNAANFGNLTISNPSEFIIKLP